MGSCLEKPGLVTHSIRAALPARPAEGDPATAEVLFIGRSTWVLGRRRILFLSQKQFHRMKVDFVKTFEKL